MSVSRRLCVHNGDLLGQMLVAAPPEPVDRHLPVGSGEFCNVPPSGLLLLGLWEGELAINYHNNYREKEFGLLPGLVGNFQIKEMF